MGQISAVAVPITSARLCAGDEAGTNDALSIGAEEDDMNTKNLPTTDTDSAEYQTR
jgi:hypothetical protein